MIIFIAKSYMPEAKLDPDQIDQMNDHLPQNIVLVKVENGEVDVVPKEEPVGPGAVVLSVPQVKTLNDILPVTHFLVVKNPDGVVEVMPKKKASRWKSALVGAVLNTAVQTAIDKGNSRTRKDFVDAGEALHGCIIAAATAQFTHEHTFLNLAGTAALLGCIRAITNPDPNKIGVVDMLTNVAQYTVVGAGSTEFVKRFF